MASFPVTWTYFIDTIEPQDDALVAVPDKPGKKLQWDLERTKRFVIEGYARDGTTTTRFTVIVDCRAHMATLSLRGPAPLVMDFYIACVKNMLLTAGVGGGNGGFFDATNGPTDQVLTARADEPVRLAGVFHRLREKKGFA